MGNRGRESAAATGTAKLTVFPGGLARRPEAPEELTDAQAKVWKDTVASETVEFFDTDALRELLKDYCRHKVTGAALSRQIETYDAAKAMDPETAKNFDRVTKMRDRESKAAADLATKLRLTNQSRYTPKAAATASKAGGSAKKPWET